MDETFTGLKLHGKIGKFAEIDISDISCFTEFESGKILSGSEQGLLLMWMQDLIQFVAKPMMKNNSSCNDSTLIIDHTLNSNKCHDGNIIFVDVFADYDSLLITAGADGSIKIWECPTDIQFFEPNDEQPYFSLILKQEIIINEECANKTKLVSMIKCSTSAVGHVWIIVDAYGVLWRLTLKMEDEKLNEERFDSTDDNYFESEDEEYYYDNDMCSPVSEDIKNKRNYTLEKIIQFPGLGVSGIICDLQSHSMITTSKDGKVCSWDLKSNECRFSKTFPSSINVSLSIPKYHNYCMFIFKIYAIFYI